MNRTLLLRALGVLAAAIVLFCVTPALAREEIRSFVSNVVLDVSGTVDVTETLQVNAEGDEIRHGIYRDLPTIQINDDKSRLRSNLTVLGVSRDGHPEPYTFESLDKGYKRIKIGSASTFLDTGLHTYVIHYTLTRIGRSLSDHDELYWNVTGNYWAFPILSAVANVTLPPAAEAADLVGFTGRPTSQEHAVTITRNSPRSITFRTTRTLAAGDLPDIPSEGLTIAVSFQKGVLATPQGLQAVGYWLSDHRDFIFPSIAVFIVLLYNFLAWSAVGRDPRKGTIIPLFHPPQGMSPALVHFINRMGFRKNGWTAFTASIFDLGVKGLVKIDTVDKTTTITATGASPAEKLPTGEAGLFSFIHARGEVEIGKADGPTLNQKRGDLVTAITHENREVFFRNNVIYTVGGLVLAALMLGALVLLGVLQPVVLIISVIASIFIGTFISVMAQGGAGTLFGRLFGFVWIAIVAANIFGSSLAYLQTFSIDTGLVAAVSIVLIEIVFGILMRAPTVQGRKVMDQIDGFKMYLETAEKNRLNYVDKGEPQMTVKRFEAILPFAIALGVEKPWTERFQADLSRNAVADARGSTYVPLWYTGTNWSSGSTDISSTMSSLSTGMAAAMIAAQPSSSSGSGFGGGGGSGGGGGGGGGGGW